jgi:hypothetical protein
MVNDQYVGLSAISGYKILQQNQLRLCQKWRFLGGGLISSLVLETILGIMV